MKILSIMLLLMLASCGDQNAYCVKRAMFSNPDSSDKPTGVTVEQAMKICGVK